jgi:hypothetical protein
MLVRAAADARAALVFAPQLDHDASAKLARALFSDEKLGTLEDRDLSRTNPPNHELLVGAFGGGSVLAAREFGISRPSRLPPRFMPAGGTGTVALPAMYSVVDWCAYGMWTDHQLQRARGVSRIPGPSRISGRASLWYTRTGQASAVRSTVTRAATGTRCRPSAGSRRDNAEGTFWLPA